MTDSVHRPAHYTRGTIEVRDFIADQQLNFNRGSAVKYIARAGHKDPAKEVEDLEKAISCIQHEVAQLRRAQAELAEMSPVPPLDFDVTDDFVSAFDDERYDGAFARIVASGVKPEGVDENDPRVVEIVRRCREASCLHTYVDGVCVDCKVRLPRITVVEGGES